MAYMALYRKYRPHKLCDVVGQEHITATLKNELLNNQLSHAYLFTGSRGTGKTSCAKILAQCINCEHPINGEPCMECESCKAALSDTHPDIHEIDAASNNSVEDIRYIRDNIDFAPSMGRKKVYIIDEVHMLSTAAFNAFLKTVEEPPEHAVFVLATTELQKVPATILSRCQRFDFRRIEVDKICSRMQYIAGSEQFSLENAAATLIAHAADGGMRDALSILDMCVCASRNVTQQLVRDICGMAGEEYLNRLTDCITTCDVENALKLLNELHNSSVDMLTLFNNLTNHYRNLMIVKSIPGDNSPVVCSSFQLEKLKEQCNGMSMGQIISTITYIQQSIPLMQSSNRKTVAEMILIRLCNPQICSDITSLERRIANLENVLKQGVLVKSVESEPKPVIEPLIADKHIDTVNIPSDNVDRFEKWPDIIATVKQIAPLLGGGLVDSKAYFRDNIIYVDAGDQFADMIRENKHNFKGILHNAITQVMGQDYRIGPYSSFLKENDPINDLLKAVNNFNNSNQ